MILPAGLLAVLGGQKSEVRCERGQMVTGDRKQAGGRAGEMEKEDQREKRVSKEQGAQLYPPMETSKKTW